MNASFDRSGEQPPSPTAGKLGGDTINVRHYWHVLLERRWLVLAAFFSVFVLSLIYLFNAQKVFEATVRLQIDRESDASLNNREVYLLAGREQDYLQTQYKILESRTLIESVVHKLDLEKLPQYAKEQDKAKALGAQIKVVPVRLSRLVDVKVENTSPQLAAKIANTLADTFVENNLSFRTFRSLQSLHWLTNEVDSLRQKVRSADTAVQKFKENLKMVSLEGSNNIVAQGLIQAQTELSKARAESSAAQQLAQEVAALRDKGTNLLVVPQIANDTAMKELRSRLAEREAGLAGLLTIYKSKWPAVMRQREDVASLRASIEKLAEQTYQAIQNEVRISRARETSLEELVRQREQEYLALTKQRIEYDDLGRDAESSKLLYNNLLAMGKQTELASNNKINNIRVVDPAPEPVNPIKPRVILVLAGGVVAGLIAALGLAFFVNYLDDSIKSQDDVETYLRLPFLGYVPNIKTNSIVERDLQSHLHPRSNAAEGFRTIRAAISLMPKADKYHILSVTSTIPSEGKSLSATNLAIVNAQTGLKTLLVDADLRRPSVHKAFQLHSPVGLAAYLLEEVNNVEEIVHSTEVPNLDVVCCGAIPSTPSELIGSKRMEQFLKEVAGRYDRVVLDCPPVSAVSDPLVLAARSDGVVFVTKFNKIRREHARRTIQRIQDAGIHILGVILNDIDFEGRDSYYYSYYYYQNRYYASHYKTDPTAKTKPDAPGKKPKSPAA